MDNGPARKYGVAQKLQNLGEAIGDPFEISTVRREVSLPCLSLVQDCNSFYLAGL